MRQDLVGRLPLVMARALWRSAFVTRSKSDEKIVHLTFDDGPSILCSQILSLLGEYDAKATFFLLGQEMVAKPDLVREILAAGHSVGNHTFSHPNPWNTRSAEIWDELDRCQNILDGFEQNQTRLMRPPYGRLNKAQLDWCLKRDILPIMWDVLPGDYHRRVDGPTAGKYSLSRIRPGSIVVLHDNESAQATRVTLHILRILLDELSSAGWKFEAL